MKKVVLFIAVMLSASGLYCQTVTGYNKVYSLEDCISIALRNNPDVKVNQGKIDVSKSGLRAAFGSYLPSASASAGYSRQLNEQKASTTYIMGQLIEIPASDPNSYQMTAGVDYNLFDGFARSASYDKADKTLQSNEYNLLYYQTSLKINVYRLYVDVIKKQQALKIQKDNYEAGKALYESIKAKYEAGVTHSGVLATQEADLASREYSIVLAENDINVAKADLLFLMGLQPNSEADFKETSLPENISMDEANNFKSKYANLEYNINNALKERYDYKSSKLMLDASKNSLEIANAAYYPKVGVSLGWSWSNNKLSNFSDGRTYASMSLNIPIFSQFNTEYQVESAKFEIMQTETELFKLEQNIRNDIQKALLVLESARKQLEISERSLNASKKNYDITKERFDIGSSSITDYILANNTYVSSQLNRVNSIYTYYLAQKELEFAVSNMK